MEETEPFVTIFWFISAFIRLSLLIFSLSLGRSPLFHSKQVWRFLWTTGVITCVEALIPRDIVDSSLLYSRLFVQPLVASVLFGILPLVMWMISALQRLTPRAPR